MTVEEAEVGGGKTAPAELVALLRRRISSLENENNLLVTNMSCLFVTARAEVQRKDEVLAQLRARIADLQKERGVSAAERPCHDGHHAEEIPCDARGSSTGGGLSEVWTMRRKGTTTPIERARDGRRQETDVVAPAEQQHQLDMEQAESKSVVREKNKEAKEGETGGRSPSCCSLQRTDSPRRHFEENRRRNDALPMPVKSDDRVACSTKHRMMCHTRPKGEASLSFSIPVGGGGRKRRDDASSPAAGQRRCRPRVAVSPPVAGKETTGSSSSHFPEDARCQRRAYRHPSASLRINAFPLGSDCRYQRRSPSNSYSRFALRRSCSPSRVSLPPPPERAGDDHCKTWCGRPPRRLNVSGNT